MKKLILSLSVLLSGYVYGQQEEQYSMYMQNNFLVNPAEGGAQEYIDIKAGYRNQWVNLTGSPQTLYLSGHGPINKHTTRFDDVEQLPFHSAGGVVVSDQIGVYDRTNVKVAYAFHLPVSDDLTISFGMFGGIKQFRYNNSRAEYSQDGTDDISFNSDLTTMVPDISAGIWGYAADYYFGVSSFQLLNNKINWNNPAEAAANPAGKLDRHYFVTGGYRIPLDETFTLVPSFVVKGVAPAPIQFDINAKLRYEDFAWLGVSYRNKDAIIALAGVTIKSKVDVSYAYDINTSGLSSFNSGSHEIIIGMRIPNHEHEPPPAQFW